MATASDAERAAHYFQAGYTVLQLCQQQGFVQKSLVNQASSLLLKSTALYDRDPRPWVCLAYLVLVFNAQEKAREYLLQALKADPRNASALALQKKLDQLSRGVLETDDGQVLNLVQRLNEQQRNEEQYRLLQAQKNLRNQRLQALKETVPDAPPESEPTEPLPELTPAELTQLPLPKDEPLTPTAEVTRLVCEALGLTTLPQWNTTLSSTLRQFQSQHKLSLHGKLDGPTVQALNQALQQQRLAIETTESIMIRLQDEVPDWPPLRLALLVNDLIRRIAMLLPLTPIDFPPAPLCRQMTFELGPPGQAGIVSQDEQVIWLQVFLQQAGYSVTESGHFDLKTLTALQQWQQTHQLTPSESLNSTCRDILNAQFKAEYEAALMRHEVMTAVWSYLESTRTSWSEEAHHLYQEWWAWVDYWREKAPRPTSHWPTEELSGSTRQPSRGLAVMILQENLNLLGHHLELSGVYDQQTQAAVRQLQRQHKLPMSGQYCSRTAQFCQTLLIGEVKP